MIKPVDPFQCCEIDGFEGTPGSPPVDHFGLVESVDRFGERIVVAITDTASRTARTRTSGENLFVVLLVIEPILSAVRASGNPGAVQNGIEHRFTKINHPWTNGQVERMNRTIKEATVSRYHYYDHDQLHRHLDNFIAAYNFGRRLKTLKGLTPYEFICKC